MFEAERERVVAAAQLLIDRKALSLSLHANISARIPGTDYLVMTGSSLADLRVDRLAVLTLDGEVVWGEMAPTEREVVGMHTSFYAERPDSGAVIHTHSPYGTAFAVASKPLPVVSESLARWNVTSPLPVARWAPRGSDESISYIADALRANIEASAVLLENHGLLVAGDDVMGSARKVIAIEENAQLAVLSSSIGGYTTLSRDGAGAARARREEFLARDSVR